MYSYIWKASYDSASCDTFLQFSMKLVSDAASLYGGYKSTNLIRLVVDDLAANNLHTKTVA